jgi:hypothetical protein
MKNQRPGALAHGRERPFVHHDATDIMMSIR